MKRNLYDWAARVDSCGGQFRCLASLPLFGCKQGHLLASQQMMQSNVLLGKPGETYALYL